MGNTPVYHGFAGTCVTNIDAHDLGQGPLCRGARCRGTSKSDAAPKNTNSAHNRPFRQNNKDNDVDTDPKLIEFVT